MSTEPHPSAPSPTLDEAMDTLGLAEASTLEARDGEMTAREITTGSVLGLSAFGIVVGAASVVITVVLTVAATIIPLLALMYA